MQILVRLLLHDVPLLLPCKLCQQHYAKNHAALKRRLGEPRTSEAAFKWCYHLKDEVNKINRMRSIPLQDVKERFLLSGGRVDDVLIADTLVLLAIFAAEAGNDDDFVEFCLHVAELLRLPEDSELLKNLQRVRRPIVTHAHRLCKNTRVEHGLRCPTLNQIRAVVL